jgi:hypothetical protein
MVRPKHPVFGGDKCHAVTEREKCKLYFARGIVQPIFESTFVHEGFGHAAFYVSGAHQMIVDAFPGDEEKAEEFEEEMIRKLENVWYPMLKEFGFQFPKIPE